MNKFAPRGFATILRVVSTALVCCCLLSVPVFAQSTEKKQDFNIAAGDAKAALKQFSAQTSEQLLASDEAISGVKTNAVKGRMTSQEALDVMLTNTGLRADFDAATRSFAVRKETEAEAKNVERAIAENRDRPEETGRIEENTAGEKVLQLETFEVLAGRTLNMDVQRSVDDTLPYVIFDRRAIERSGATNLERFFQKNLTAGSYERSLGTSNISGTTNNQVTTFNLRGLGDDETLILVDGRRIARTFDQSQITQANINGIPLSAVERIEVLPTTASAIYGGSATGGVINIVLRRDYSGAEVAVTYGNTFATDAATRQATLSAGFQWQGGRTRMMLSASWEDANSLRNQDRNFRDRYFAENTRNLTPTTVGSIYSNTPPPLAATTNIRSVNGSNLTLKGSFGGGAVNSPITFVPYGYAGPQSDNGAALIGGAGQYNLDPAPTTETEGGLGTLFWAPERTNFALSIQREVNDSLKVFAEVSRSKSQGAWDLAPSNFVGFTLQPTSDANPFNQAIVVTTPILGAGATNHNQLESERAAVGAIFKLPSEWKAEIDVTYDRNRSQNQSAPLQLLASANTAVSSGAINVFRDTNVFPVDFSLHTNALSKVVRSAGWVESTVGTVRASGPAPFFRWIRKASVSALAEYRDEQLPDFRLVQASGTTLIPARSQSVASIYAETRWPIVDQQNRRSGIQLLDFQFAARWDEFRNTAPNSSVRLDAEGNPTAPITFSRSRQQSVNPMAGFRYKPMADFMMRGSYGTGFLAPSLLQLAPGIAQPVAISATVQDPLRGNATLGTIQVTTGGNPRLAPEESTTWSTGLVMTPRWVKNLRLSVDWVQIEKTNAITTLPSPQNQTNFLRILNNFPERITRGEPSNGFPVGPITGIDTSNINATLIEVEAVDYALDYSWITGIGSMRITARATNNKHLVQQLLPSLPQTELVDTIAALEWRGALTVAWERGPWSASWSTQYVPSYYIDQSTHQIIPVLGTARFSEQIYHDLTVGYQLDQLGRWAKGTEVLVGVNNVFNREPPVSFSNPYYANGDPRLSNYFVSVKKSF
jgi:iron complex outermembrane receptor protein